MHRATYVLPAAFTQRIFLGPGQVLRAGVPLTLNDTSLGIETLGVEVGLSGQG